MDGRVEHILEDSERPGRLVYILFAPAVYNNMDVGLNTSAFSPIALLHVFGGNPLRAGARCSGVQV
jgi:hypothetical protein